MASALGRHWRLSAFLLALGIIGLVLSLLYVVGSRWIVEREVLAGDALPPGVPGRIVLVHGHRVHVIERGTGPAVLLVHGTAGTTLDWEGYVLDTLAQRHHVVALDLYGMGFSERAEELRYGFRLWADELAGTLDALGIERASVIGQSLGGAVAAVFAGTHPARVERLVSVDSGPWLPPFMLLMLMPGTGEVILGRSEYWPERPDQPAQYRERLRQVYRITRTRRHLLKAIRAQFLDGREYFRALSHVTCPTLLVHGTADNIIPLRAAASLRRWLSNSRMIVLEGAGHFSMQDRPQQFVQEVSRFLDEVSRETSSRTPRS
jgi:2-hydroxymuconate-semialdehyde hydrolase